MTDIITRFVDTCARYEILHGIYFAVTDLIDIPQSADDLADQACGDAECEQVAQEAKRTKPMGKQVW